MKAEANSITIPSHLVALRRHFIDLRDGKHGDNAVTRHDKESLFAQAVDLLEPYAQQALMEINEALLLGTGIVSASGLIRYGDGDLSATWSLSWREQVERRIDPVTLSFKVRISRSAWVGCSCIPSPASVGSNYRQLASECL